MKVVHLISGLVVGGAEMTLCNVAGRMSRERFDNRVICLGKPGPMLDRFSAAGVPVLALGMARSRPSIGGFYRLVRALRQFRPDVLQTWLYHADLAGLLAGTMAGVPAIVWNIRTSDMDMTRYSTMSALTRRACARWSHRPTAVVVNSRAGRCFHEGLGYRPKRWALIPNGIDTSIFKPDEPARCALRAELGVSPDAILIGSVGRFDPAKDQIGMLRAAASVARRDPRIHFVLAGANVDWDNPVLRAGAAVPDLEGRVSLLGPCTAVPRLMAALDLMVSSSSYGEAFPNVLAEAMSSGVPCVATAVGDSQVIVGTTGEVVAPGDPAALAAGITRMTLLDPAERTRRGLAARTRILEEYDMPVSVARYERFYESLQDQRECVTRHGGGVGKEWNTAALEIETCK